MKAMKQVSVPAGAFLLIGLVVGFGWSCGGQNNDTRHNPDAHHAHTTPQSRGPVATLEGEVLAIHDSVMPRMSDLLRLKKAVAAKVKQTDQVALKQRGQALRRQLDEADEAMMNWMYRYNADTLARLDEAKASAYLRAEKAKIEQVRTRMQQSIAEAEAFIQSAEP